MSGPRSQASPYTREGVAFLLVAGLLLGLFVGNLGARVAERLDQAAVTAAR